MSAPLIPRYLRGQITQGPDSGKWGIYDQAYSVLRPIAVLDSEDEARAWLEQHPDEIPDPTAEAE